jgi:hypothetical protein
MGRVVTNFLVAGMLPESIMHTAWFTTLSTFVAINTTLYVTIAMIKLLPKIYLSDWVNRRNRRSESRSIYPSVDPGPPRYRRYRRGPLHSRSAANRSAS